MWDGTAWSALAEGTIQGVDGPVFALVLEGERLYVGGDFFSAAGENATNIAVFERGDWSIGTLGKLAFKAQLAKCFSFDARLIGRLLTQNVSNELERTGGRASVPRLA